MDEHTSNSNMNPNNTNLGNQMPNQNQYYWK